MRIALLSAFIVALLIPASAAAADNPWLAKRVLNIAHQGGEDEFPSNTLYAVKRSVKAGADMLELGVMTARPIAFEQMRAGHAAPEAGG
jgi:glycerophosphoryl diester phosphodiesterase